MRGAAGALATRTPASYGNRVERELRDIPLLFLTGLASAADLKAGQLAGRPAMSKSEPIDKLVARIESLIAK